MDFRTAAVLADGFGVNFLDTSVHGHTGGIPYNGVEEGARIPNSFGVGFKTFQATSSTVTYDGLDVAPATPYSLPQDTWASMSINVERNAITKQATVDVTIYDQAGQAGTAQSVFRDSGFYY